MVKLAQHIEWSTPIPPKAGDGASYAERRTGDRISQSGKSRKTLAELFDTWASSSSSTRSSSLLLSSTQTQLFPGSIAATRATTVPIDAASSTGTGILISSSDIVSTGVGTSSESTALSISSRRPLPSSARSSASSVHPHVTFDDTCSYTYHECAKDYSAYRSSESVKSIKRSSSARKIADSSRHNGTSIQPGKKKGHQPGDQKKGLSKSGPLPRSPLANASNASPSLRISPVKPDSLHTHANPDQNFTGSSIPGQRRGSSSVPGKPFGKFNKYEHIRGGLLHKSLDAVESLRKSSMFSLKEADPFLNRTLNAWSDLQTTPAKVKKMRQRIFGLSKDTDAIKDLREEPKGAATAAWKWSDNFEKNAQKTVTRLSNSGSLPKVPSNIIATRGHLNAGIQNHQHSASRVYDHSSIGKEHETTSLTVEIPEKMVGLAWIGLEPQILPSGNHTVSADNFVLEQVISERVPYVNLGCLHRVHIPERHLGVAWVGGKATLLEAGTSVHDCPSEMFSYIITDEKTLSEKEFVLGPFRIVTVDKSEIGIKFCNRQPQVLYPGRHYLSISKVEVFMGFESLSRRQSCVHEVTGVSNDNRKVNADILVEWQIKAEDAAAARFANVTDVEGAVCNKVRRAFNLAIWELNVHDMELQLGGHMTNNNNGDLHPLLKNLSSSISKECQDLFEEGWNITIWDLQLQKFAIQSDINSVQGAD